MLHQRNQNPNIRKPLASLGRPFLLLGLCLASCMGTKQSLTPAQEVDLLVRQGKYQAAVEMASQLSQDDPVSAEYERLHQRASMAFFLEQGRRATFADNDRYAITRFEEVLKLDPTSDVGKSWLLKTQEKLAQRLTAEGRELASNVEYEQAFLRFEEALRVVPNYSLAEEALEDLDRERAHRQSMGSEYYDQGVAALVAKEFAIASNRFGYVRKYRDEDERLLRRSNQVDEARSVDRTKMGEALEKEMLYHASRASFQAALNYDPSNEAAQEGLRRASLEADVNVLMARAQSATTRSEFDIAAGHLEEAKAITQQQTTAVEALHQEWIQARLDSQYETAVRHQNDLRYEQAIGAFQELLSNGPGYKDAQERMAELTTKLNKAADMYQVMTAEQDPTLRLGLLMELDTFCPGFEDVPELMDRLLRRGVKPPTPVEEPQVE